MPKKNIYPVPPQPAGELSLFPLVSASRCSRIGLEELARYIEGPALKEVTDELRQLRERDPEGAYKAAKPRRLPAVCVAALCEGGHSNKHLQRLTMYCMVDFDGIEAERMGPLWELIRQDPHTLMALRSVSGRGFHVIAPYHCASDKVAYIDTWDTVASYYEVLLSRKADAACKDATRMMFLNHDPEVVYRPAALALEVPAMVASAVKPQLLRTGATASLGDDPLALATFLVERSGLSFVPGSRHHFLVSLCFYLLKMGVEEPAVVAHLESHYASHDEPLPRLVGSVYKHAELFNTWQWYAHRGPRSQSPATAPKAAPAKKMPLPLQVEELVREAGRFRRNVVKNRMEERTGEGVWEPVTDASMQAFWLECCHTLEREVRLGLVQQTVGALAPGYNPLAEWYNSLPAWDGEDHIGRLFGSIRLQHPELRELFLDFTRRWFVGLTASLLDDEAINHSVLVLVGAHGCYKSQFLRSLVPPEWGEYFLAKTDASLVGKDDRLALASHALICFEEMGVFTGERLAEFKGFVTIEKVNERAPYTQFRQVLPHRASVCGCTNQQHLLGDITGERRVIPFAVASIPSPYERTLPYPQLYAQALALFRTGFRYWLTVGDIAALQPTIRLHTQPSLEQEMLDIHYRPAEGDEHPYFVHLRTLAELHASLCAKTPYRLSPERLSQAIHNRGYASQLTPKGTAYRVVEKKMEERI